MSDAAATAAATNAEPVVLVDVADHVATITLNRPAARNALNRATQDALWDAVATAGAAPEVAVVILTGADPAFCAGVDLKEVGGSVPTSLGSNSAPGANSAPPRDRDFASRLATGPGRGADGLYRFLPVIDKPVIGAINGVAVTGGLEVALQCTFLIASDRARFGDSHARVGIMPGGGLAVLLAQSVGLRKAIELSLTGNFLSAPDALRLGLVNHVVPHEDLLPFTRQLAADIAGNDQAAVRRLHQHYRRLANAATLDEAHLLEGLMAQTWPLDADQVAARRAAVTARGRVQAHGTAAHETAASDAD